MPLYHFFSAFLFRLLPCHTFCGLRGFCSSVPTQVQLIYRQQHKDPHRSLLACGMQLEGQRIFHTSNTSETYNAATEHSESIPYLSAASACSSLNSGSTTNSPLSWYLMIYQPCKDWRGCELSSFGKERVCLSDKSQLSTEMLVE